MQRAARGAGSTGDGVTGAGRCRGPFSPAVQQVTLAGNRPPALPHGCPACLHRFASQGGEGKSPAVPQSGSAQLYGAPFDPTETPAHPRVAHSPTLISRGSLTPARG